MIYDENKYKLRFAWFPKTLSDGRKIWFENYYRATLSLPIIYNTGRSQSFEMHYTIRNISTTDYLVETLKGNIVDGIDQGWTNRNLDYIGKIIDEELGRAS